VLRANAQRACAADSLVAFAFALAADAPRVRRRTQPRPDFEL